MNTNNVQAFNQRFSLRISNQSRHSVASVPSAISERERPDSSRSDIISRGSLNSARKSLPSIGPVQPWSSGGAKNIQINHLSISRSQLPWSNNIYSLDRNLPRESIHKEEIEDHSGILPKSLLFKDGIRLEKPTSNISGKLTAKSFHKEISNHRPESTVSSLTKRLAILNRKQFEYLNSLSPISKESKENHVLKRASAQLTPLEIHHSLDEDDEFVELRKKLQLAREKLVTATDPLARKKLEKKSIIEIKRPKTSGESFKRLTKSSKEDILGKRINPEVALQERIVNLRNSYQERIKLKNKVQEILNLRKKDMPKVSKKNYIQQNVSLSSKNKQYENLQMKKHQREEILKKKDSLDKQFKINIEKKLKQREFIHDFNRMQYGIQNWMTFISLGFRLKIMKERFESIKFKQTDVYKIKEMKLREDAITIISKLLGPYITRWREKNFLKKNLKQDSPISHYKFQSS